MKESDEAKARDLFFRYDGSRFYMSRDGVENTYLGLGVPPETEAAWMEELTVTRLEGLDAPGNWQVVHFIAHHSDVRHLDAVLAAKPQGKTWERCAYVESLIFLLKLADIHELVSASAIDGALKIARQRAVELRPVAQSEESQQRVERAVREIDSLKENLATGGSLAPPSVGWWSSFWTRIRGAGKRRS